MHCRDEEPSIFWIEDNAALADAVASWHDSIGLDTEFIRTDTFYPIPGLYQIASGAEIFLLDPLAIDDWAPFVDFLEDPKRTKVMHACQEDLELMHVHLQCTPQNLVDTQLAYAYVSKHFSLSYANLVKALVDADLAKQQTRSNWLKRPLSQEQIWYAVDDVIYLVEMFEILKKRKNA